MQTLAANVVAVQCTSKVVHFSPIEGENPFDRIPFTHISVQSNSSVLQRGLPPAQKITNHQPQFALHPGTKLKTAGNVAEGMARYLEAVEVCPTYAAAFYNQGVVHSEGGRVEAATASYHRAVELFPQYAEAWCNLGVIYRSQVRHLILVRCRGVAGFQDEGACHAVLFLFKTAWSQTLTPAEGYSSRKDVSGL